MSEGPELKPWNGEASLPLEAIYDAVLVADASGRIRSMNARAALLLQRAEAEIAGANVSEFLPAFHARAAYGRLSGRQPFCVEADCRRGDGSAFPAEVTVGVLRSGESLCFLVRSIEHHKRMAHDLRAAQARLVRAERLETAGMIAGKMAHDVNNLLTPLLGYAGLIRNELSPGSKSSQYLEVIEGTVKDMSQLMDQVLSLARRGRVVSERCRLNEVVEQIIALEQNMLPPGISIEFNLADDLLPVRGGRQQLLRVLENLCQNAIEAMGERGVLRLTTENVYLDAPLARYESVNIGEYVKLAVADNGPGISEEIRDKIFDPFFTTKKKETKQRGSGLGLSIVHGIVKDHDGYIDLDSTVGKGSVFSVYLPVYRGREEGISSETVPHGTEAILIVDDDESQIEVMTQLLKSLGYRVTGSRGGDAAVRLFSEGAGDFGLVVLDMVMDTGMDGLEAFKSIRAIKPDQRVILISGFEKARASVLEAQKLGAGAYLRKPLTMEKLGHAVRQALDGSPARDGAPEERRAEDAVLIVDDEEAIRQLFAKIIAMEIPTVVTSVAANGVQAVEAFRQKPYSVVVMDLYMPDMNGRQAYSEIEEICVAKGWAMPAVIFCTGFALPESLDRIIADGRVHCLLRKPVRPDLLVQAVRDRLD